jgi:LysR family transcriptional regulator, carnitine catabolism transcriptional activator
VPINVSAHVLRAFLALADTQHFTRAAERCSLSQSAFSQLIRRLEEEAGTALFNRTTRTVTLTAEGRVFVESARRLLADIEAAFEDLKDRTRGRKGRVAVAALPSLAATLLPAIFAAYRRRFPGVKIELFDCLSDRCLECLSDGRVDFALTAPGPRLAEFENRLVLSEGFYLVCHREHPLARKTSVQLQDLKGYEMVHFARMSSVRQHVEPAIGTVGSGYSGLEVEQLATVAGLVAAGLGISLVPELTLFQFKRPELAAIPVESKSLTRPIFVVQRRNVALSPPADLMLKIVEEKLSLKRFDAASTRGGMRKRLGMRSSRRERMA